MIKLWPYSLYAPVCLIIGVLFLLYVTNVHLGHLRKWVYILYASFYAILSKRPKGDLLALAKTLAC